MLNKPEFVQEQVDITDYNTMGVAAKARFFSEANSIQQLSKIIAFSTGENIPLYFLGGGSNVLFIDDYDGFLVHINIKGIEVKDETDEEIVLKIGAGENWHNFVTNCVRKGWGGVENLSLIPGSVGAAPIQNIGAYGVELEQVFESLEALDVRTGEPKRFTKQECNFGYRDSIFKNELKGKFVITSVMLRLQKSPKTNISYHALSDKLAEKGITKPSIRDVSNAVIEIRKSKLPDPAKIGNTGSFFKNPVITKDRFQILQEKYAEIPHYPVGDDIKIPAAWLIDQCGWKGKRFGDAGVHYMQALVIVNYGKATGPEIWELAQNIQKSVKDTFGIALSPEVNVVG
jgi:UDP-N-acetylmuramate dehydrogenase